MESETRCPRCGAAHEPQQEYCLDCGARLPAGGGPPPQLGASRAVLSRRLGRRDCDRRRDRRAALELGHRGGDDHDRSAAAHDDRRDDHRDDPDPAAAQTEAQTQPKPKPSGGLTTWPAGTNGYTVVLESIPSSAGAALPLAAARHAQRSGLPQVGVLASSSYASLHPGYSVVFSGVYPTSAAASAALPNAHARGFPSAYQARVATG